MSIIRAFLGSSDGWVRLRGSCLRSSSRPSCSCSGDTGCGLSPTTSTTTWRCRCRCACACASRCCILRFRAACFRSVTALNMAKSHTKTTDLNILNQKDNRFAGRESDRREREDTLHIKRNERLPTLMRRTTGARIGGSSGARLVAAHRHPKISHQCDPLVQPQGHPAGVNATRPATTCERHCSLG